jgi:phosphohistidine phosphatase
MLIHLIRHAHALDSADDPVRPLSKRGRRQVRALARFLRAGGAFAPAAIWHSPLARSRETAELLAGRLGFAGPLVEVPGLEPGDDPRDTARRIQPLRRVVAIVGHEPHLSALASLLVTGASGPPAFVLKKCAALALERTGARWQVRWQVSPELLA